MYQVRNGFGEKIKTNQKPFAFSIENQPTLKTVSIRALNIMGNRLGIVNSKVVAKSKSPRYFLYPVIYYWLGSGYVKQYGQ